MRFSRPLHGFLDTDLIPPINRWVFQSSASRTLITSVSFLLNVVMQTVPELEQSSSEGLVRGIRKWDLVAVAINAVIGAGIFGLPSKVYALIGSYSLIAFIVCALVVVLIILCFAEVGSRFDETGGPYLYAREAFGPTVAFEVGWLIWLARLTAFAANCNLMVAYLAFFWPAANTTVPRALLITAVVICLAALNVFGVRQAAIASNLFTVGKLIPMLIFIAAGLFFLNPHAFALGARPSTGAFSQSVLLLIYAFTGFEMAAIPAGEIRDPQKHLPRALLLAIALVACLYILIQVVCIGTLPELASSPKPLADAGQRFMGTAGGAIISAGAIISIAGNLNIVLLSGSRVPFAIAEQGTVAVVARVGTSTVLHSACCDSDHRGRDAGVDAEEFLCRGPDD